MVTIRRGGTLLESCVDMVREGGRERKRQNPHLCKRPKDGAPAPRGEMEIVPGATARLLALQKIWMLTKN
jgi:hypothetical protein